MADAFKTVALAFMGPLNTRCVAFREHRGTSAHVVKRLYNHKARQTLKKWLNILDPYEFDHMIPEKSTKPHAVAWTSGQFHYGRI